MTFPSYGTGEIAPSAWANLVGDFHDDRFLGVSLGGGLGAAVWNDIGWSVVEDPNGWLQPNTLDILLPATQLFLAVFAINYDLASTNPDHLRMEAIEGALPGLTRLRVDPEISVPVNSFSGLCAGLIQGNNLNYRFRAFTNIGGTVPTGGTTNLTIIRVGG